MDLAKFVHMTVLHRQNLYTSDRSDSRLLPEQGASLLELALLLPVIVIIVAGIIDYGSTLREIQVISMATREGARIAASHARVNFQSHPLCLDADPALVKPNCDYPNPTALKILPTDPVAAAARKATCSYLLNAGMRGTDWEVKAEIPDNSSLPPNKQLQEDGKVFDAVTVAIEKSQTAAKCIVCWEHLLDAFKAKSESTFLLEANCDHS